MHSFQDLIRGVRKNNSVLAKLKFAVRITHFPAAFSHDPVIAKIQPPGLRFTIIYNHKGYFFFNIYKCCTYNRQK